MTKIRLMKPLSSAVVAVILAGCAAPGAVAPVATPTPTVSPEPTAPPAATPATPAPAPVVAEVPLSGRVAFRGEPLSQASLALFDARTGSQAPDGRLAGDARTDAEGNFSLRLAGVTVGQVYRLVATSGPYSALAGTFVVTSTGIRPLAATSPAAGYRVAQAADQPRLVIDEIATTLTIAALGQLRLSANLPEGAASSDIEAFFDRLATAAPVVAAALAAQPATANRLAEAIDPATGGLKSPSSADSQLSSLVPRDTLVAATRDLLAAYSSLAGQAGTAPDSPSMEAALLVGLGVAGNWSPGRTVTIVGGDGTARDASQAGSYTRPSGGSGGGSSVPVAPPPTVASLSPQQGPAAGGTNVTITGTGFTGATGVSFGGTAATAFTVVSDTEITATAPARNAGAADVTVTTANGTSAVVTSGAFTYVIGRLYISTWTSGIYSLSSVASLNGAVTPTTRITGQATGLAGPLETVVDPSRNLLYVANNYGVVTVYANADTATGNQAPVRTITGFTGLRGLAIDPVNDRLYACFSNTIWIIDNASTVNGPLPSTVRQVTGTPGLSSLTLDIANDRLYTGSDITSQVNVFDNASTMNGTFTSTPKRVISGPDTGLNLPMGVYYHAPTDKLYVANYSNQSVVVFNQPGAAVGNVLPTQRVTGSDTGLGTLWAVIVDEATNELLVGTDSNLLVYGNANTVTGNVAPTRTITLNTGLTNIRGLSLDPTR
jgi:hypothetical protein